MARINLKYLRYKTQTAITGRFVFDDVKPAPALTHIIALIR